ncbi:MAG: rlmB 2 [Parachlamydiales bacterium]|nr:rlmB 2 [Parachlamydiales bacterium]
MKNKRQNYKELKYYGLHACLAIWQKRPEDIIRIYLDAKSVKTLSPILKWCSARKIAYHIIESDEMAKVSDSIHHEGVCMLAREPRAISWPQLQSWIESKKIPICLLYLDGVQNPHNIGSILRSSAHFGIPYVLGEEGKIPALSPSACRIAKGGAETVRLVSLADPVSAIDWLKKNGFFIVSTSSHEGSPLYRHHFHPRSLIALGSESDGVGRFLKKRADGQIQIPGTGEVESLNVSVAASLLMSEYCRTHGAAQ